MIMNKGFKLTENQKQAAQQFHQIGNFNGVNANTIHSLENKGVIAFTEEPLHRMIYRKPYFTAEGQAWADVQFGSSEPVTSEPAAPQPAPEVAPEKFDYQHGNECGKCGGKGYLPEYRAVNGGLCFACNGTGKGKKWSNKPNKFLQKNLSGLLPGLTKKEMCELLYAYAHDVSYIKFDDMVIKFVELGYLGVYEYSDCIRVKPLDNPDNKYEMLINWRDYYGNSESRDTTVDTAISNTAIPVAPIADSFIPFASFDSEQGSPTILDYAMLDEIRDAGTADLEAMFAEGDTYEVRRAQDGENWQIWRFPADGEGVPLLGRYANKSFAEQKARDMIRRNIDSSAPAPMPTVAPVDTVSSDLTTTQVLSSVNAPKAPQMPVISKKERRKQKQAEIRQQYAASKRPARPVIQIAEVLRSMGIGKAA